jgi:sugar phosphate isomerase/epimerase
MEKAKNIGCECCQISVWDMSLYTDENARKISDAANKYNLEISTLWVGWSGPKEWNFTAGPMTLGIVPTAYRMIRVSEILMGADFAAKIGVSRIATHVGFLPENINDPQYYDIIAALRYIASECKKNSIFFLFETGQETPTALLRVIEDIGADNVGINMDTANLILYGKGNPVDALDVFGEYVFNLHAKDGTYPTNGMSLGKETPIGEGAVDFPKFIAKLKAIGYDGDITIEREISGDQQKKDIVASKAFLETLF